MNHPLRHLFFYLLVRPLVLFALGLNVRHRGRLPAYGPAIVVANHNSHLDTLVLMILLRPALLRRTRPVAAADYFLRNRWMAWLATRIIGIIPIERSGRKEGEDPLEPASEALDRGEVLILFPEGTRGEPECLDRFKSGIAHLARRNPEVPVTPVFLHGLGKSLPKGAWLPVPFFVDVFVGEALFGQEDHKAFMVELDRRMAELAAQGSLPSWD